jgi:hypothetical protein
MALLAELPSERSRIRQGLSGRITPHFQFNKGQYAQPRLAFRIENQAEIKIRLTHFH